MGDWKLYSFNANGQFYHDPQSITHPSENIVRVWERMNFTEKGVINWLGQLGKGYENLSQTKALHEIDCAEKKQRVLSLTYYDKKGKVIWNNEGLSELNFSVPDTIAESLYKEICK